MNNPPFYEIEGQNAQILKLNLRPDQRMVSKAGSMVLMDDGISFDTSLIKPSETKSLFQRLWDILTRRFVREPVTYNVFQNHSEQTAELFLSSDHLGDIVAFDFSGLLEDIICRKEVFLASEISVDNALEFVKDLDAAVLGKQGFILQRYSAEEGHLFLHTGGRVVKKRISQARLLVDVSCLLAFTSGLEYRLTTTKTMANAFFGGEGLFLAELSGTGTVWVQSVPLCRMANSLLEYSTSYKESQRKIQKSIKKVKRR